MASFGALIYNPQLSNNTLCFKCLNSNASPRTIFNTRSRNPNLHAGFSNRYQFSRRIRSAFEDAAQNQREISTGGTINGAGPAVDDSRTGNLKSISFYPLVLYELFLLNALNALLEFS